MSPVHRVLIEESIFGWKEYELDISKEVAEILKENRQKEEKPDND